jgi:hypothetical protein
MRALDRKLLRDLSRMKLQALAIALVIAAGVTLFLMMFTAYHAVLASEHHFYTEQRFAHAWSSLARAPRSVALDLAAIPGVSAVDARIVTPAILDVPGLAEPGSALVVGISASYGHAINDLYLRRGRRIEAGHAGEILISETFADANHLGPGSSLSAVINGRDVRLRIIGVALSPEYVMAISPSGINDDRRFGIAWMDNDQLAALVDKHDAFDDVALQLAPGSDERAVLGAVDRVLAPRARPRLPGRCRDRRLGGQGCRARPGDRAVPRRRALDGVRRGGRPRAERAGRDRRIRWHVDRSDERDRRGRHGDRAAIRRDQERNAGDARHPNVERVTTTRPERRGSPAKRPTAALLARHEAPAPRASSDECRRARRTQRRMQFAISR